MEPDPTLAYASPRTADRGPSAGNGIVGVLGMFSWVFSVVMFYLVLVDRSHWTGAGLFLLGLVGGFGQFLLTLATSLVYFLCCRQFNGKGHILVLCIIIGAPVATAVASILALVLPDIPLIAM